MAEKPKANKEESQNSAGTTPPLVEVSPAAADWASLSSKDLGLRSSPPPAVADCSIDCELARGLDGVFMSTQELAVFLTVEDLARRWHRSESTIRSDVHRSPRSLPPLCKIPGVRRLLWRLEDIEKFESECVLRQTRTPHEESRRRGRPTKSESIRRRIAGGDT